MQFPIKINQTNLSEGGRQKLTSQTNSLGNSFDQILAGFNFSGQTLASDRQSMDPTIQNESGTEESRMIEQAFPSEEDWLELDLILSSWIAEIHQVQYSQDLPDASSANLYSGNKAIISAMSPIAGSIKEATADESNGPVPSLQKVESTNQTATLNLDQFMQRLEKVMGELQSQEEDDSIEIPVDIRGKIQLILDESNSVKKPIVTTPVVRQTDKNPFFFDHEIQEVSVTSMEDGKRPASHLQNVSETKGNLQPDLRQLSTEEQRENNTTKVTETELGQQLHTRQRDLQESSYSGSNLRELSVALVNNYQQAALDHRIALGQWLEKVEGVYQGLTFDSNKLIQHSPLVIGELQVLENQSPIKIDGKTQMILDDVLTSPSSLISKFIPKETSQDEFSFLQDEAISSQEKQPLTSAEAVKFHEEGKFDRISFQQQLEESTKSTAQTVLINQQQKSEDWNVSKAAPSSPILSVSEFVPEVSGWIGGYLRSTNGQLGNIEARFSLYPEHLGHIEIKITSQLGQITAQIVAETGMAKEALEGQLHQLRQALQQHGLQVKNLEIVQQTPVSMDAHQANLAFSQGDSSSPRQQRTFTVDQNGSKKQNGTDETEMEKEQLSVPYGGAAPKTASQIDFTA
ncbi:flagellar hook-length control protein FliK [Neobacillus vireti]|nr:flagellar hook-length control protein FliK [Neobacillus vireti]